VAAACDGRHPGLTPPNAILVELEQLLAAREAARGTAAEAAAAAAAYGTALATELERQRVLKSEAGLASKAARKAREQGTEEECAREAERK
jgi:hypothetical protein